MPTGKPVLLTLKREGFKPFRINKLVSGERMPLSGALKREPLKVEPPAPAAPLRRPTGYKDNPY